MAPAKKGQKKKPRVWIMRTGEEILITEMDDSHLAHTIAMLERKRAGFEAESIEHEDWEEGPRAANKQAIQRLNAMIGMLVNERDRRKGLAKKIASIADMLRIELEGPHIGERII